MYVLNITDDYDIITTTNCTDNENIFDIFMPTLLLSVPCGPSFLCLLSLLLDTLIKPLIPNKW